MDEQHTLIHMLLEDSEQNKIQNEFLEKKLESLVSASAFAMTTKEIENIQEKISFVEEHMDVVLSAEQKSFLEDKVNEVMAKTSNGKYCKSELISMDTAKFQKLEITLSSEEVNKILDEVNEKLGGWTHFAANGLDKGESFRRDCMEIGAYTESLGNKFQADGSSIALSGDEILANYNEEVEKSGYTGMFVPYVLDKLGLVLSLVIAFVLALFQVSNQGCTNDVIAIKSITAAKYMGIRCIGIVFMVFAPCLASTLLLDVKLCMQGASFGYDVNPYIMPAGTILVLLPEVIFLALLGMFIVILLNSAVVPFLLEAVFFGISVNDFYGCYGLNRIVIRFNLLANSSLVKIFWKDIIGNRLFVCLLSVGIFGLLVLAYHFQKYGKASWGINWLQREKEKIYCWKNEKEKSFEIKKILRKEEADFSGSSIYKYLFQLGYQKSVIYCIILDIASYWIFYEDMSSEQIFIRFLPLNAIIIFSGIGFAEQEGQCSELIIIKNRIHIYFIQFIVSSMLVVTFVLSFGIIFLACSIEVIANVLLFSIILGSIYTIFQQKFGVVSGTFIVVMIYIFTTVSIL